ncbi:hypothetical protein F5Y01DRAFT_281554 [Xylaria sp. FL0043]|nr:hypothetical protein F5Y01DRAFT_281554 [Xylaria sp. FL0043]
MNTVIVKVMTCILLHLGLLANTHTDTSRMPSTRVHALKQNKAAREKRSGSRAWRARACVGQDLDKSVTLRCPFG